MLAHHQDDQYETFLIRLIGNSRWGLTGIKSQAGLPESDGIHGVYESGGLGHTALSNGVSAIEQPSFKTIRPLLSFPKDRLAQTCRDFNVSWVEDETNADPTLTARNAIRHIVNNSKLPEALRKSSVLALRDRLESRRAGLEAQSRALFDQFNIRLDVMSGAAEVKIPFETMVACEKKDVKSSPAIVQALTLRHCLSLVCPQMQLDIGAPALHRAAKRFLLRSSEEETLNVAKVQLTRMLSYTANGITWLLERQSPYKVELSKERPRLVIPPFEEGKRLPDFKLWDGRFWMLIHNPSRQALHVCFFEKHHVDLLVKLQNTHHLKISRHGVVQNWKIRELERHLPQFGKQWKHKAWTTPVIEVPDPNHNRMLPIALPAFGIVFEVPGLESWPTWLEDLRWEIRYKAVDLREHYKVYGLHAAG
jgi:tRNA(Ile)-lysidine synthase